MIFWLILVLAFVLYYILIKPHRFWKDKGVRQGKPWILLGDTWGTMFGLMDVAQSIKHFYDKFPGVRYYGIYQFLKPKFVVKDPELIKRITVKDFDHFVDHVAMVDPEADPLFAKNLLNLRGDDWRNMRSTLSGSFTSSKMKAMFALMTDAAENFVKYFKKQNEDLLEVELKDAFTRFTIDVIATTSFGVQVNSLEEKKNEFFLMGKEITHLSFFFFLKLLVFWFSPSLFKRFKFRMFRKAVTDFFTRVITDTIRTREAKGIYRPDMLQILIEAKKGAEKEETNIGEVGFAATKEFIPAKSKITKELTDEDITAQAVIFFFAGFDSVSSAMTFATYELATHPDVQERLRQEIQETLNASNGKVTFEALTSMKYMDMVLSESLRKWPSFVALGRECTKPYVIEPTHPEEKRVVIPKGTPVQIPLYGIHHDPKYYPNPANFDPERFSPENRHKITPYTYLPFGSGPRNCLGSRFALLEVKTVIFYVLNNFELLVIDKTQVPIKLSKKFVINIRPDKGLWLGLKKIAK